MRLPTGVATIVIGNPLIADASAAAGGLAGRHRQGLRLDQPVALDRSGRVLLDKQHGGQQARAPAIVVIV